MSDTATPDALSAATTADKASPITSYVVLQRDGDGWIGIDTLGARSAEAAIREAVEELGMDGGPEQEGTFVAIPARSWKPVTVTAKVETTLELKPAS